MKALSIEDSIDRIVRLVMNGSKAFFINTQFGKIAIETDNNYDTLNPVSVIEWKSAPPTPWCMEHRNSIANYYCLMGISQKRSKLSVKMHTIELITKCIFMHLLGTMPEPEIIDAGVSIYCMHHEMNNFTLNQLEREFCNLNFNLITKNDSMVKDVVRELIRRRINESERIIEVVHNSYISTGYDDEVRKISDIDYDPYLRDMFGLVIYFANNNGIDNRIGGFADIFMSEPYDDSDDIIVQFKELDVILV